METENIKIDETKISSERVDELEKTGWKIVDYLEVNHYAGERDIELEGIDEKIKELRASITKEEETALKEEFDRLVKQRDDLYEHFMGLPNQGSEEWLAEAEPCHQAIEKVQGLINLIFNICICFFNDINTYDGDYNEWADPSGD